MAYKFYRRPEESWHPDSFREILFDALNHSDPDFDEDGVAGNRLDENEMWCKPSDLLERMNAIEEMQADKETVCIPLLSAFRNREWKCRHVWPTAYASKGFYDDCDFYRTLEIWTEFDSGSLSYDEKSEILRVGLAYMSDHVFENLESDECTLERLHVIFHTKDGLENDLTIRAGWYEF